MIERERERERQTEREGKRARERERTRGGGGYIGTKEDQPTAMPALQPLILLTKV